MRPARLLPIITIFFIALILFPNLITAAQSFQLTIKNKLNVRSGPSTRYTILGTLAAGDVVDAIGRSLDSKWYVIAYQGGQGWIINAKANFVSVGGIIKTLPGVEAPPLPSRSSSAKPTTVPAESITAAGPTCPNIRATCTQLRSCDEAKACLAAGNGRLDRDNDGIPCESLCGG